MRSSRPLIRISSVMALLALLALATTRIFGCGINWTVPDNHFDGVDERGDLSYWQNIGTLDLGNGLRIPLIIGFNSARNSNSPYLGQGWILALLESNIVQTDPKHFMMVQPDGYNTAFSRKKETDAILHGWSGWMGQIDADTITVWAPCGWKMVYTRGKLSSITTPQNHQLTYVYQNNIVKEIDEDNVPILTVHTDLNSEEVTGLTINNRNIGIVLGQMPKVDNIAGMNVVGEVTKSLNQVILGDKSVMNFKFALTPKLVPTLDISGATNRFFTWDPATRYILQDGDWTYKIAPGAEPYNAQITRTNTSNKTECWYRDKQNGLEITQGSDGIRRVTSFFTTGILKGKLRKIEEQKDGASQIVLQASYDETGHLIRAVDHGNTIIYQIVNNQSMPVEILSNDKPIWSIAYDSQGKLVKLENKSEPTDFGTDTTEISTAQLNSK